MGELRVVASSPWGEDRGEGATKTAEGLAEFPERGRLVPEYRSPSIREIIVGSYRATRPEISDLPASATLFP